MTLIQDGEVFLASKFEASQQAVDIMLNKPIETGDDCRSRWYWIRLANGDLVLGFFPQADAYEEVETLVESDYQNGSPDSLTVAASDQPGYYSEVVENLKPLAVVHLPDTFEEGESAGTACGRLFASPDGIGKGGEVITDPDEIHDVTCGSCLLAGIRKADEAQDPTPEPLYRFTFPPVQDDDLEQGAYEDAGQQFVIPKPDWGDAENVKSRGDYYGFQMYSTKANNTVGDTLTNLLRDAERTGAKREVVLNTVAAVVKALARSHGEIYDSEPEQAITDAVNAFFDRVGFAHVNRESLF